MSLTLMRVKLLIQPNNKIKKSNLKSRNWVNSNLTEYSVTYLCANCTMYNITTITIINKSRPRFPGVQWPAQWTTVASFTTALTVSRQPDFGH